MENATKALLIAAAILIAILIISLSLVVYRMASETVGNVDLSEAEMAAYNSKFEAFEGDRVSGAQVNALLTTVITHNQQDNAGDVTTSGLTIISATTASIPQRADTSKYYKVVCTYGNGLVTSIAITENKDKQ